MILDTSALVAILFREPEAELFTRLIHSTTNNRISAGTCLELAVVLERQAGLEADRQREMFFRRAGIVIEAFTEDQLLIARQAFHDFGRGRHAAGLNFGDCFAYALARYMGEPLLFKGDDFRRTDIVPAIP
ncbi:MAG TPA: type II toxin-antitoxin system VapC family toxin [Terriglobia bacterium]|nr:type II toxin-antitoxin system VapC family toxin [Terriglobia bacterium]